MILIRRAAGAKEFQAEPDGKQGAPGAAHRPSVRSSRRPATLGWGIALAAMVIGFAIWQVSKTGTDQTSLSQAYGFTIGTFDARAERNATPAPDLEGPALGGGRLSLSDYRGKVVVLNLWASWCGPCRREQPVFERLWQEYEPRGVQFLGLNIRDTEAAALAYRDEFDVTYPSFVDPSSALAARLRTQVLPTTYVIDRDLRIIFRLAGTVDEVLCRRSIEAVLEGSGD